MSLRFFAIATFSFLSFAAHAQFDGSFYHARYGLTDTDSKLVNNHGEGFEPLYGIRNFREVLNGVMYRGGANNVYNRDHTRPNSNPLPDGGLMNLCQEGFKTAIYLYTTNFETAPPMMNCNSLRGSNQIDYVQRTFNTRYKEVLETVHAAILDPEKGPVYVHCWNGWHASGMLSAFALKQFCGWSTDKALAYWIRNTDGDSNYPDIKNRIRQFQPYPELMIDAATQARICPR